MQPAQKAHIDTVIDVARSGVEARIQGLEVPQEGLVENDLVADAGGFPVADHAEAGATSFRHPDFHPASWRK